MGFGRRHPRLGAWLAGLAAAGLLCRIALVAAGGFPEERHALLVGVLGGALLVAAGAAWLLTRPGARGQAPDLDLLLDRGAFLLRRIQAAFCRHPGEAWYRWALQASSRERAVAWLEMAAGRDHPEAHFELGLYYEESGQGPGGRGQAARHYRSAAEQGHAEASFRLAELMRWGIGPDRDPGAAHRWYLRSAHAGFRPAMDWLVRAYEFGEGLPEDLELAVFWTLQARAAEPAGLRVSHFARSRPAGSGGERTAAAVEPRAGETFFRLGMSFQGSAEQPRDPAAARLWLRRAAEAGHLEAMVELGALLATEEGGLAHSQEAHRWLQQAGQAGHRSAQIKLGRLER